MLLPGVSLSKLLVLPVPTLARLDMTLHALRKDMELLSAVPGVISDCGLEGLLNAKTLVVVLDAPNAIISPVLGLRLPPAWSGHVALERIALHLRWLAVRKLAAVVVTNRLVSEPPPPRPALGNRWAAFVDVCITLSRKMLDVPESQRSNAREIVSPVVEFVVSSKRDRVRRGHLLLAQDGMHDVSMT